MSCRGCEPADPAEVLRELDASMVGSVIAGLSIARRADRLRACIVCLRMADRRCLLTGRPIMAMIGDPAARCPAKPARW